MKIKAIKLSETIAIVYADVGSFGPPYNLKKTCLKTKCHETLAEKR